MRGIIDHHQDERKHLDTCGDDGGVRRIDTSAGSACSLVANEAAALQSCQEDAVLSTLLLGTIAADCRGFDPKQVSSCGSGLFYHLPPKAGFNWRGPARR